MGCTHRGWGSCLMSLQGYCWLSLQGCGDQARILRTGRKQISLLSPRKKGKKKDLVDYRLASVPSVAKERLWSLHACRPSRATGTGGSSRPCLSRGLGPTDAQRGLPTTAVLWFPAIQCVILVSVLPQPCLYSLQFQDVAFLRPCASVKWFMEHGY